MSAEVINGQELASQFRKEFSVEVKTLKEKGVIPKLTVVLIGNDPASHSYVKGKERAAAEIGLESEVIKMESTVTENELLNVINELNTSETVHGILIQLPLPEHFNEQKIIEAINPQKDVDGFHPINIGRMIVGQDSFSPCTPFGIIKMLKSRNIKIEGQHVVVIGRSNIVGKPMGQLLLNENATVTYCHSRTQNLKKMTKMADILIVAMGKENVIDASYVKEGATVIDVGVNRTDEGTLTGDVDFADVKEKAAFITPVPKGVGPMTITMLLGNTIKAAKGLSKL